MIEDLYEVLGVARDAPTPLIRAAYRKQAIVLHPDRSGDPKAYALLQEAYTVLANPQKRKEYDGQSNSLGKEPPPSKDSEDGDCGGDAVFVEVPKTLENHVAQIMISQRDGTRTLDLAHEPPVIPGSRLREREVLVQMLAMPLSTSELYLENTFQPGDCFGMHGVGRVVLVGPEVSSVQKGDLVVPIRSVDEDGNLKEDHLLGTGRTVAVFPEVNCARLNFPEAEAPMSISQLALAKSIGAALHMIDIYTESLTQGETVVVNCANGIVGQALVQLLASLKFKVIAVCRPHDQKMNVMRRHMEMLGAEEVIFDGDDIKHAITAKKLDLPKIVFDGVGGSATAQIASCLSKTGDLICFGTASGSKEQVLPFGWGKKWRGVVSYYCIDEWLQEDLKGNSMRFSDILVKAGKLMQDGALRVRLHEFSVQDFTEALKNMHAPGRTFAVVFRFPGLDLGGKSTAVRESRRSQLTHGPRLSRKSANGAALPPVPQDLNLIEKPIKASWDVDFLEWEESVEPLHERNTAEEGNLFKPDPVIDEMRIAPFVDDALATPVAVEMGASLDKAKQLLFWLPGADEVPEEHEPWLDQLCAAHSGLRVFILKPRTGFRWFEMSDQDAVKLGLRFGVTDDIEANLEGDVALSSGEVCFPPLSLEEIEATRQIEGVALGLARRAVCTEKDILDQLETDALINHTTFDRKKHQQDIIFGGFGQGGSVALYAALCIMDKPIAGVVFSHSGVPVPGLLGKRMNPQTASMTQLCAVYDKADKEVPAVFPETLHKMFELLHCRITLRWLLEGDGHFFAEEAATTVLDTITKVLEAPRPSTPLPGAAPYWSPFQQPGREPDLSDPVFWNQHLMKQWREYVSKRRSQEVEA